MDKKIPEEYETPTIEVEKIDDVYSDPGKGKHYGTNGNNGKHNGWGSGV